MEIQGSAQDNAIYELAHGISEVESSIQRELELFKHQFDEAKSRFTENSKRVSRSQFSSRKKVERHFWNAFYFFWGLNCLNLKVRDNDEKMQDELERFEREEKRLVKIKLLNTELRGEKERIELKKKDMMKVSKTFFPSLYSFV